MKLKLLLQQNLFEFLLKNRKLINDISPDYLKELDKYLNEGISDTEDIMNGGLTKYLLIYMN